jgi:hypothetical protein
MGSVPPPPLPHPDVIFRRIQEGARSLPSIDPEFAVWAKRQERFLALARIVIVLGSVSLIGLSSRLIWASL